MKRDEIHYRERLSSLSRQTATQTFCVYVRLSLFLCLSHSLLSNFLLNWNDNPRPPQSPEDGHIYCILLIRIVFCHVSKNLSIDCLFYVTMNIYFCFYLNIAREVVTVLLLFVDIYHFKYTFSHTHIEAHTHKHTCIVSTQEEWRQSGTGAWLRGTEEKLMLKTKA